MDFRARVTLFKSRYIYIYIVVWQSSDKSDKCIEARESLKIAIVLARKDVNIGEESPVVRLTR